MEMVENPMTIPEIEYNTSEEYWRKQDEIWAEKEDRDYQDKVFEEMIKEENKND